MPRGGADLPLIAVLSLLISSRAPAAAMATARGRYIPALGALTRLPGENHHVPSKIPFLELPTLAPTGLTPQSVLANA